MPGCAEPPPLALAFSAEEETRYARTIALKEVGWEGQHKLKRAKVLVVGAGGLGSPVLLYLAGAGVGTLGIVDHDRVEVSNLQRQVIHTSEGAYANKLKVDSAAEAVNALNPHVKVLRYERRLVKENMDLPYYFDVVVDCLDNFETRYLLSDACVKFGKPLVTAAVDRFQGMVRVMCTKNSPCMRCEKEEVPQGVDDPECVGLFGTGTGILGAIEAQEVLKLILGVGQTLEGKTLIFDGKSCYFNVLTPKPWGDSPKNPECKVCGGKP